MDMLGHVRGGQEQRGETKVARSLHRHGVRSRAGAWGGAAPVKAHREYRARITASLPPQLQSGSCTRPVNALVGHWRHPRQPPLPEH